MGEPLGSILQKPPDQCLIAPPLNVRDHKLAHRVDDFRFPLRLAFVLRVAMPLIGFQGYHIQTLDARIMKGCGMQANLPLQPPDDARMDFRQPRRRLEAAPSARWSATASALSSVTFVFHKTVVFRSLNSAPQQSQWRYRIASFPYLLRTLRLCWPFCPYNSQRSLTHAKVSSCARRLVASFVFIPPSYPATSFLPHMT